MIKVRVEPLGIEFECEPGANLLKELARNGVKVRSLCKGVPSCAECRVRILEGFDFVLPPSKEELALIGNAYFLDQRRLSCQCRIYGPIVIDVSEHLRPQAEVERKIKGLPAAQVTHAQVRTLVLDNDESDKD